MALASDSKASSSFPQHGRGKKVRRFLASLTATGGSCSRVVLECLTVLRRRGVDCGGALAGVPRSIPPPPTCVSEARGVSIVCFGFNRTLALWEEVSKVL